MIDFIVRSKMHIICTLRSKTETAQVDDGGRKKVAKLGMKAEQRDGIEYELTTVLDLVHDGHFAMASKDRTGLFTGKDPQKITPETGSRLLEWLNSGKEMLPTAEQLKSVGEALMATATATGKTATELVDALKAKFAVASSRDLTASQADEAIRWLAEQAHKAEPVDL